MKSQNLCLHSARHCHKIVLKECAVSAQLATFIEWKNLGHCKYLVSSIFSQLLFNRPFKHQIMVLILDGPLGVPVSHFVDPTGFPK